MDRCEAATTLFQWQMEGQQELVASAGRGGSLLALVEAAVRVRPRPVRRTRPPAAPIDFLKLDEERAVEALRARLHTLAPLLRPEETHDLKRRLQTGLMPAGRIAAVRADLDRLARRQVRETLHRELEAQIAPPRPAQVRALLLFARDGRLLASEGDGAGLDMSAVSTLVGRREPGSTWSLAHSAGVLVGHLGERAALVALFAGRPGGAVPTTLRASVASLEKRDRLLSVRSDPANHTALMAYLRAVQVLLLREK